MEASIEEIIKNDEELETLFSLLTSVPGIGTVVAREVILATGEGPPPRFKVISEPKKLACHAGVAPFERYAAAAPLGYWRARTDQRKPACSKVAHDFNARLRAPG